MTKQFQQNEIIRRKIALKLYNMAQDYRKIQWLNSEEACKLLGVNPQTLAQYRKRKLIPYSKIGRRCFYAVHDLEKLLYDNLREDEK